MWIMELLSEAGRPKMWMEHGTEAMNFQVQTIKR